MMLPPANTNERLRGMFLRASVSSADVQLCSSSTPAWTRRSCEFNSSMIRVGDSLGELLSPINAID
jgi:hypothetical protein